MRGGCIMKRIFLASVSLLALMAGRSVLAADLAAALPTKAPPRLPPPSFSWTGCYVGANIGGGWGSKELTDVNAQEFAGLAADAGVSSINDNVSGLLGGGQIGCNYQFAQNWVIGLEGDISGADINGAVTATAGGLIPTTFSARTNWIGSVDGRLGYAWDRWLVYVQGGAAWARDKYQATSSYYGVYNSSETRSGWTLGGGLEWAFADHWSARLQYNYYDFGSRTLQFTQVSGFGDPLVYENVKQQIQSLTVGVNYRF
jgi:outer membrane immunogenic protein